MISTRLRLAFALATLPLGFSAARADSVYVGTKQFPGTVLVDPSTGAPYSAAPSASSGAAAYGPDAAGAAPTKPPLLDGHLDANGKVQPNAPSTPLPTQDPQNAPYGVSGSTAGGALTPGNTTAATPGRNIHIFCAPTTSPATGYTTLTEANGETHQVQLATGAQYDFPWAVTLVAAQTTVTGTLAACEFKNMN